MQEAQNTKVVQEAFAAFLRGDTPGVLATLDDKVVWQPVIGAGTHVPFAGKRQGKAAVDEFFRLVNENETFEQFEPREFVAQGDKVVALGHYKSRSKRDSRTFESDWVMIFTLRNGKVVHFQEFSDSAAINAAF